ncbi:MAG TPA: hypothetical protein VIA18_12175, partial [Polyangia bacterium]|nr:hypothetical protein [Polyangia bacterium]
MDTVSVGRLSVDCVVPRNHANPTLVKRRLDDVALGPLGEALAELLAPLSRLGDEVIVIRRLELSFDLDTGDALPDVARRWAARLAASIAESLRPEARATMLRFADEAHYLARFLVDTAGGHAAQRWYYRRYRGLAALAQPAALRSAILDEPARGLTALQTLSASELTTVLAALGAREAQRVLETLMAHDAAAEPADDLVPALVATAPAWRPVA